MHVASMHDYEEHMVTWAYGVGTTQDFNSYTWVQWAQTTIEDTLFLHYHC